MISLQICRPRIEERTNGHNIPGPEDQKHRLLRPVAGVSVSVAPVLRLLPLIVQLITAILLYPTVLHLVIWLYWCSHRINVLLVYSSSPNWQEYIETYIIPELPASTVVLNRSEHGTW